MRLIHTEKFEHGGKTFEIRISGSGWDFLVKAYLEGKPANGFSYTVDLPTAIDLEEVLGLHAIELQVARAKADIVEDVWRLHVENHVANLTSTTAEQVGCRKCGSRKVDVSQVDEREMYLCQECDFLWYSKRGSANGAQHALDGITEEVGEKGASEINVLFLVNCVFRDGEGRASFTDRLSNWTKQNHLSFEYTCDNAGQQNIRFFRSRMPVQSID